MSILGDQARDLLQRTSIAAKDAGGVASALSRLGFRRRKRPPAPQLIIWLIALLFVFLLVWAAIAEIDEVTRGDGKVIPVRKTQTITSSEPGTVQEILVRQGQKVHAGDILVRLDNSVTLSNLGEAEAKLRSLKAQAARLEMERDGRANQGYQCPEEIKTVAPDLCRNEATLLATRYEALAKRTASLGERYEQKRRELNEAIENSRRIDETLALAEKELALLKPMAGRNIVPQTELLKSQRAVAELSGQQSAIRETIARSEAAVREAKNNLDEIGLQFRQDALSELTKIKADLSVIEETTRGAADRVRRTDIRSPVDGVVNALNVNTIGSFVQPGSRVLDIVPLDDNLLIEAKIRPADIGFLRAGQPALVKITAFDFSIYGGLNGRVTNVSADSVYDETARETFYTALIETDKSVLVYKGAENSIIPGMICQVEILTGKKTILNYLLKPILKMGHEALSER